MSDFLSLSKNIQSPTSLSNFDPSCSEVRYILISQTHQWLRSVSVSGGVGVWSWTIHWCHAWGGTLILEENDGRLGIHVMILQSKMLNYTIWQINQKKNHTAKKKGYTLGGYCFLLNFQETMKLFVGFLSRTKVSLITIIPNSISVYHVGSLVITIKRETLFFMLT